MRDPCFKLNPLQRGGTGKKQRRLDALQPSYVRLDERKIEELIVFADKFAELLAYYDSANRPDGDWRAFISSDLSTLLARVIKTKFELVNETWQNHYENFNEEKSAENYKTLFDIIFSLFLEIERINQPEIINTPIKDDLNNEIKGRLKGEMKKLIGYYRGAKSVFSIAPSTNLEEIPSSFDPNNDDFEFVSTEQVLEQEFSPIWIHESDESEWKRYIAEADPVEDSEIPENLGPFGDSTWPWESRIDYSSSFIKDIYQQVFDAYVRIILRAREHFQHSLEHYPRHKPHNALLLTFFRLFAYAQEDLNALLNRHLQFYYRDVLRFDRKPAKPDSVHMLAELAKHKKQHLIKKGTELKAGKGAGGKELIYTVDEDVVVNKASVASLKTVYVDSSDGGGVFDAPVANSRDGMGEEELDPENPVWRTFGQPQAGLSEDQATMQFSEIGFAIASPVLRLAEGKRQLTFTFSLAGDGLPKTLDLLGCLAVRLSGEEEWIECPALTSSVADTDGDGIYQNKGGLLYKDKKVTLWIVLDESYGKVVDYDSEKFEDGFITKWPVAKFLINRIPDKNSYQELRNLRITDIEIEAKVSEVSDLVLQNDFGILDPTKPFLPFGPRPKVGNALYIGSRELFSKPLSSLNINIKWMDLPLESFSAHYDEYGTIVANNDEFEAKTFYRYNGKWGEDALSEEGLFDYGTGIPSSSKTIAITDSISADSDLSELVRYDANSKSGFLKIELSYPPCAFGHGLFSRVYADAVIGKTDLPNEPYTPTIQSLSCDYTASEFLIGSEASGTSQFIHIYPFGHCESTEEQPALVPQFDHQANVEMVLTTKAIQGSLYIGIADAKPTQAVSILMQVGEGTENASEDASEVVWSYLSDTGWNRFDDEDILSDSTRGLLGSGIIRFYLPKDISDVNPLMPAKCYWLRASISEPKSESSSESTSEETSYDAFPQMVAVHAQAFSATFEDRKNDPGHLAAPLPASRIGKLVRSESAIKKIIQPYESFNGHVAEEDAPFYQRVAERLRHKRRAITLWDYERLVLEQFPFIYKAKCLNHTNDTLEVVPGAVRIVVIPDMHGKKAGDKLKPAISANKMKEIEEYIARINCGFVDLRVIAPEYEPIIVHCNVTFRSDPDYYKKELNEAITRFLAPWAFNESEEITFGGTVHQSTLINYIEKLEYVDYISNFYMKVINNDSGEPEQAELSQVIASDSRTILTSHHTHMIYYPACSQDAPGS